MSMSGLLTNVAAALRAIPGVRYAPDYPPERLPPGVVVFVFPAQGSVQFGVPSEKRELIDLKVQAMVPRKDLENDIKTITGYHELLIQALMIDPTFGGNAETYDRLEWTFGPLSWGDTPTVGYDFTILGLKVLGPVVIGD